MRGRAIHSQTATFSFFFFSLYAIYWRICAGTILDSEDRTERNKNLFFSFFLSGVLNRTTTKLLFAVDNMIVPPKFILYIIWIIISEHLVTDRYPHS